MFRYPRARCFEERERSLIIDRYVKTQQVKYTFCCLSLLQSILPIARAFYWVICLNKCVVENEIVHYMAVIFIVTCNHFKNNFTFIKKKTVITEFWYMLDKK